jgi:hypothetical protein
MWSTNSRCRAVEEKIETCSIQQGSMLLLGRVVKWYKYFFLVQKSEEVACYQDGVQLQRYHCVYT